MTATCPLDGLLLDHLAKQRRLAAAAAAAGQPLPRAHLIGPPRPTYEALLAPDPMRRAQVPCHPASRMLADVIQRFPDIARPPERAAVLLIMYLVLRWQAAAVISDSTGPLSAAADSGTHGGRAKVDGTPRSPSEAYLASEEDDDPYERMPAWCRPTPAQGRTGPYPIWVDHIPWPGMRLELARDPDCYPLEVKRCEHSHTRHRIDFPQNHFIPYTTTLSLNWPYGDDTIWEPPPERNGDNGHSIAAAYRNGAGPGEENWPTMMLSKAFEAHVMDLSNWSLGPAFAKKFPKLVDGVRIVPTRRT